MKKKLFKFIKWLTISVITFVLLVSLGLFLFKDKIIGAVVNEVNQYLKVPVKVSQIDITFWQTFPKISVDFNNVYIQSAVPNALENDTLLYTDRIRLKFNPIDIWNGNYSVESLQISPGTVKLNIAEDGSNNYDIFKPSPDTTSSPFNVSLKKIVVEGLRVSYLNQATQQHYSTYIQQTTLAGNFSDKQYDLQALGKANIYQAKSGEVNFIKRKWVGYDFVLRIDNENNRVDLPKALINIAGLPFEIEGGVGADSLRFSVKSKDILLTDLVNKISIGAEDKVKEFKGEGKINFDLSVFGAVAATESPTIICKFGVANGSITEPSKNVKIKNVHLDGLYTNEGGAQNERLELRQFQFATALGPFSGKAQLTEFNRPHLTGSARGKLDLKTLHAIFPLPGIDNIIGKMGVNADFDIVSEIESGTTKVNRCNGSVDLQQTLVQLLDDDRVFKNINAHLFLKDNQAGISDASLNIGSTDLRLDGYFNDIFSYLNATGFLTADLSIESNFINLADFSTREKQPSKYTDGRQFVLPEGVIGNLNLTVGKLKYETHHFDNIIGKMTYRNRKVHLPKLSLVNADALVSGALVIEEKLPEIFTITANVATRNLKFKQLFREWENFQQEVITDKQISGRAEADLYLHAPFDLRSGIIMKAIQAKLDLRVYDGQLKNVESFSAITKSLRESSGKMAIGKKSIDNFERKLVVIDFKTLENSLIIRDGKLEIPKMHIASSALELDISGIHSFENEIDYRFAFRLRDVLVNTRDAEFGEIIDDGTGMWIYMRMFGNLDDPKIEWDKSSKKEQAKANREQAKQDAKGILKAEFGLFQNDTSVKVFVPKDIPKEELIIQFGPATKEEFKTEKQKEQKESKFKKTLNSWKQEQENDQKASFKVGGGGN